MISSILIVMVVVDVTSGERWVESSLDGAPGRPRRQQEAARSDLTRLEGLLLPPVFLKTAQTRQAAPENRTSYHRRPDLLRQVGETSREIKNYSRNIDETTHEIMADSTGAEASVKLYMKSAGFGSKSVEKIEHSRELYKVSEETGGNSMKLVEPEGFAKSDERGGVSTRVTLGQPGVVDLGRSLRNRFEFISRTFPRGKNPGSFGSSRHGYDQGAARTRADRSKRSETDTDEFTNRTAHVRQSESHAETESSRSKRSEADTDEFTNRTAHVRQSDSHAETESSRSKRSEADTDESTNLGQAVESDEKHSQGQVNNFKNNTSHDYEQVNREEIISIHGGVIVNLDYNKRTLNPEDKNIRTDEKVNTEDRNINNDENVNSKDKTNIENDKLNPEVVKSIRNNENVSLKVEPENDAKVNSDDNEKVNHENRKLLNINPKDSIKIGNNDEYSEVEKMIRKNENVTSEVNKENLNDGLKTVGNKENPREKDSKGSENKEERADSWKKDFQDPEIVVEDGKKVVSGSGSMYFLNGWERNFSYNSELLEQGDYTTDHVESAGIGDLGGDGGKEVVSEVMSIPTNITDNRSRSEELGSTAIQEKLAGFPYWTTNLSQIATNVTSLILSDNDVRHMFPATGMRRANYSSTNSSMKLADYLARKRISTADPAPTGQNGDMVAPADPIPWRKTFYISCQLVSIPLLALTLAVYWVLPQLSQSDHGKSTMCYLLSVMISFISLTLTQLYGESLGPICSFLGYLMHLCILTIATWLNVMCFDIYWAFSVLEKKNEFGSSKFRKYSLYAWGLPTGIVLLTILLSALPLDSPYLPDMGGPDCFYQSRSSQWLYCHGPTSALMALNVFMFLATTFTIYSHSRQVSILSSSDSARSRVQRRWFRVYTKLFLVSGMNWVVELLSLLFDADNTTVVFLVTDTVNVLLGVFVFVILLWHRRVWSGLRKWWTGQHLLTSNRSVLASTLTRLRQTFLGLKFRGRHSSQNDINHNQSYGLKET